MHTCYRCAKVIKGKRVHTNPPVLHIKLGIDFPKTFHPICYQIAENEAHKAIYNK